MKFGSNRQAFKRASVHGRKEREVMCFSALNFCSYMQSRLCALFQADWINSK